MLQFDDREYEYRPEHKPDGDYLENEFPMGVDERLIKEPHMYVRDEVNWFDIRIVQETVRVLEVPCFYRYTPTSLKTPWIIEEERRQREHPEHYRNPLETPPYLPYRNNWVHPLSGWHIPHCHPEPEPEWILRPIHFEDEGYTGIAPFIDSDPTNWIVPHYQQPVEDFIAYLENHEEIDMSTWNRDYRLDKFGESLHDLDIHFEAQFGQHITPAGKRDNDHVIQMKVEAFGPESWPQLPYPVAVPYALKGTWERTYHGYEVEGSDIIFRGRIIVLPTQPHIPTPERQAADYIMKGDKALPSREWVQKIKKQDKEYRDE